MIEVNRVEKIGKEIFEQMLVVIKKKVRREGSTPTVMSGIEGAIFNMILRVIAHRATMGDADAVETVCNAIKKMAADQPDINEGLDE